MFFKGFEFTDHFPYLYASEKGLSIFFTSPALLLAIRAKMTKLNKMLLVACGLVFIPILLYLTTGEAQFGYRYLADLLPFLLVPLASGFERTASTTLKIFLVTTSVIFILIGVNQWNTGFL